MLLVPLMYRQVCLPDIIPKNLLLVGETQDADNLRPVTYCANVLDRIYRIKRIFGGSSRVERVDRVDWGGDRVAVEKWRGGEKSLAASRSGKQH